MQAGSEDLGRIVIHPVHVMITDLEDLLQLVTRRYIPSSTEQRK
jgi:hypothetical protein